MTSRSKSPRERSLYRETYKRELTAVTDPDQLGRPVTLGGRQPVESQLLAAGVVERGAQLLEYRELRIYFEKEAL